jgi:thiamine pyrophosphokinase
LPPPAFTIAADSGVNHAHALDLPLDAVVGDLDSASPEAIDWARTGGAEIEAHRPDKDQTDLELALAKAARWISSRSAVPDPDPVDELVVIGLDGGRIDHRLANLLTLAGPHTADIATTAYLGSCRVSVVRDARTLWGRPGELVSLLAVGGPAEGVTTRDLVYPLDDDRLAAGSARGMSNRFAGPNTGGRGGHNDNGDSGNNDNGDNDSSDNGDNGDNGDSGGSGGSGGMVSATVTVRTGTLLALQPHALSGGGSTHPPMSARRDG